MALRSSGQKLGDLLKRPEVTIQDLNGLCGLETGSFSSEVLEEVEIQVKYEGYLSREKLDVTRLDKFEETKIPGDFSFNAIPGLSKEIVEKLSKIRPISLGQARRISGVTPAAIQILSIFINR